MVARMARRSRAPAPRLDAEARCAAAAAPPRSVPGRCRARSARLAAGRAPPDVVVGLDAPDDAAVIAPPAGKHLVQTVDFFRAFIDDPYVFGEIAANHALNDVFAMGGDAASCARDGGGAAGANPPRSRRCCSSFSPARAPASIARAWRWSAGIPARASLALGFSVTGEVAPERIMRKGGLKAGDALILTEPLGTGDPVRCRDAGEGARARGSKRRSPRCAAPTARRPRVLLAHGARAMTDVTRLRP